MAEYDNTNTGALFKNNRRTTPTQPDWNGSANIEGVEYWTNAWVKESKKDGAKFFSMSYRRKEEAAPPPRRSPAPAPTRQAAPAHMDLDDEVPF
jgi:hypothetical protein